MRHPKLLALLALTFACSDEEPEPYDDQPGIDACESAVPECTPRCDDASSDDCQLCIRLAVEDFGLEYRETWESYNKSVIAEGITNVILGDALSCESALRDKVAARYQ